MREAKNDNKSHKPSKSYKESCGRASLKGIDLKGTQAGILNGRITSFGTTYWRKACCQSECWEIMSGSVIGKVNSTQAFGKIKKDD